VLIFLLLLLFPRRGKEKFLVEELLLVGLSSKTAKMISYANQKNSLKWNKTFLYLPVLPKCQPLTPAVEDNVLMVAELCVLSNTTPCTSSNILLPLSSAAYSSVGLFPQQS